MDQSEERKKELQIQAIMALNHVTPLIMEIKCPLLPIGQSDSRKKELQNYEINLVTPPIMEHQCH